MTAHTRLSSKGQIVIPKDVRDRLRWKPGTELEVVETLGGITVRAVAPAKTATVEEVAASLREIMAPYRPHPPATIGEISSVPDEALAAHYAKEYPGSRDKR